MPGMDLTVGQLFWTKAPTGTGQTGTGQTDFHRAAGHFTFKKTNAKRITELNLSPEKKALRK